jgi:hypothetical protein
VLVKTREIRARLLIPLITLLLMVAATQLGPVAISYAAPGDVHYCEPEWAIITEVTSTGLNIQYRCEPFTTESGQVIWMWNLYRFVPANNDQRRVIWLKDTSPPYRLSLNAMVGGIEGGGAAAGSVFITGLDGTDLNRRIASRTIMQVQTGPTSGWLTCHDTGWKEASIQRSWMKSSIDQFSQPDCGNGYYRAQVAGRFWSITLGTWITRGWTYSPAIWVDGPPGSLVDSEPTVTPTPEVVSLD